MLRIEVQADVAEGCLSSNSLRSAEWVAQARKISSVASRLDFFSLPVKQIGPCFDEAGVISVQKQIFSTLLQNPFQALFEVFTCDRATTNDNPFVRMDSVQFQ